jgi:hypothetical protein
MNRESGLRQESRSTSRVQEGAEGSFLLSRSLEPWATAVWSLDGAVLQEDYEMGG